MTFIEGTVHKKYGAGSSKHILKAETTVSEKAPSDWRLKQKTMAGEIASHEDGAFIYTKKDTSAYQELGFFHKSNYLLVLMPSVHSHRQSQYLIAVAGYYTENNQQSI